MPKILVSCAMADGHVNPFLPVVAHLVQQGHDVVWICGRSYGQKIEAVGAKFVPMPIAFDPEEQPVYEFKPELKKLKGIAQIKFYIKTWCYDAIEPTMEIIDNLRQHFEPDLYLSDPMVYAPYFKAEMLNKPSINLHVLPLTLSSKDHGPFGTGVGPVNSAVGKFRIKLLNFFANKLVFNDLKKIVNRLRLGMDLPPYNHIFNGFLNIATTVFTTTIPGFDYKRSDLPDNIKYLGPVLPMTSEDFEKPVWWQELFEERKVILVTQGTIANDTTELILPTIEGLRDENVLLLVVPVKEEIPNCPENVRTADFIPFVKLLPHVDLMVTNGGFGAVHIALSHGIPIVSSGGSEDKMEVSARVAFSGAGINLKRLSPKPRKIRDAVFEVLINPAYKENAARLQREIKQYQPLEILAREVELLTS